MFGYQLLLFVQKSTRKLAEFKITRSAWSPGRAPDTNAFRKLDKLGQVRAISVNLDTSDHWTEKTSVPRYVRYTEFTGKIRQEIRQEVPVQFQIKK